jgi:Leucine-rich repeat (LRR) protein
MSSLKKYETFNFYILDIEGNTIDRLPSSVISLTQLKCLYINKETRVPKGIGRLTALEELSLLGIHDDSIDIVEELGHLAKLRVLKIYIISKTNREDNCLDKSLVECLNKLHKIQNVYIQIESGECNLDGWVVVAPQHLRWLQLRAVAGPAVFNGIQLNTQIF